MTQYCIIITGPTGVGKTDVAQKVAEELHGEIINCDVGQWYVPLTIGTAKPAWKTASVAYHLFDIIATPTHFSVINFRAQVQKMCVVIWQRQKIPIIVGGSSYYVAALFFPPVEHGTSIVQRDYDTTTDWWQQLYAIDPQRAKEIDRHDTYRIARALDIWYSTGIKPSEYKPTYNPLAASVVLWLNRDRQDLYNRINQRVIAMMEAGWIDEVRSLMSTAWESFLLRKKIIGYPEIIAYVQGALPKESLITTIQKKTRNYAKRQITFWRMLSAKIKQSSKVQPHAKPVQLIEVNLTHTPIDGYIKQLVDILQKDTHE